MQSRKRSLRRVSCALAGLGTFVMAGSAWADAHMRARAGGELPLVGEKLEVEIDHQVARIHLEQRFENPYDTQVEGIYDLDLGADVAVAGFAYWNGDKKIVGEVFDTELASSVFDTVARRERRDPGLLRLKESGAFGLNVYPIEPHEVKRLSVDAERWLRRTGRDVELTLPVDLDATTIDVRLRDPRPIGDVTSPTHELTLERGADGTVHLTARGKGSADSKLVLRYRLDEPPFTLAASIHRSSSGPGFVLMTLDTPPATGTEPTDLTLLIDCGGSMGGAPLDAARRAAAAVIARLGPNDRVNVVPFSHQPFPLYPEPWAATPEVRRVAATWSRLLGPDWYGDVPQALATALAGQHRDARADAILLFSNGAGPSLRWASLVAARDSSDARLYAVAAGPHPQTDALAHLAAAKNGALLTLGDGSDSDPAVQAILDAVRSTPFSGLHVDAEGGRLTDVVPERLPSLSPATELRIVAKLEAEGEVTLHLRGREGPTDRDAVAKAPVADDERPWLARLWAKARIDELLASNPPANPWYGVDPVRAEVTELGLTYDLVTPYTSFLAIPETELNAWSREVVGSAREVKRRLLAEHPEAVSLSRQRMPPGDPLLSVAAPADARRVTARFPFGLTLDLAYAESAHAWRTRFLVPKEVRDGTYTVTVAIVDRDGRIATRDISYVIDSAVEDFDVEVTPVAPRGARIRVRTHEAAAEVRIARIGDTAAAQVLARADGGQLFQGALDLPPGKARLRVVVADLAQNEALREIEVEVAP